MFVKRMAEREGNTAGSRNFFPATAADSEAQPASGRPGRNAEVHSEALVCLSEYHAATRALRLRPQMMLPACLSPSGPGQ